MEEDRAGVRAVARRRVDQLCFLHPCPWLQLLPLGLLSWRVGHGAGRRDRGGQASRVCKACALWAPCGGLGEAVAMLSMK